MLAVKFIIGTIALCCLVHFGSVLTVLLAVCAHPEWSDDRVKYITKMVSRLSISLTSSFK